jgi:hypothetical protein
VKVRIAVHGCDDSTEIEATLDVDSVCLLEHVAEEISAASEYGCQPTMEVECLDG